MLIEYIYPYYYTEKVGGISKVCPEVSIDTPIVTNNCDAFDRTDNILDIRILKWVSDNHYNGFKDKIKILDNKSMLEYMSSHKELCKKHQSLLDQAFHFTKIHKIINKNHHFQYNKNELMRINEKIQINEALKEKLPEIELESIEELQNISTPLVYDFRNPVGKIMGKGFNLTKFDRKKYMNLFKTDDAKYYLVDIKSFEPSLINYYIPNYITDEFYEENSKYFNLERSEFKQKFLSWINGAGEKSLGTLYSEFPVKFKEIEELKNKLTGNSFKNVFGKLITVDKQYKRLGYLVQSTAGSLLQDFHLKLSTHVCNFEIIWSLFDEFLIKGDVAQFVSLFKEAYPILNMKVEEV